MMKRLSTGLRRRLAEESGFTLIEGMIASLMLVIGSLAVLQTFDAGQRNTFRTEQSQAVNDRLQAELEAIKQLPFDQVALTTTPTSAGSSLDPRWRVSGTQFAVNRNGTRLQQMAYNSGTKPTGGAVTGGVIAPGPTPFTAGDVSGDIYRFVTWSSDPNCPGCGTEAIKRVVVAVRLDDTASGVDRQFQEVQTEIADPNATPDDNTGPPPDEVDRASAQFWLTDTTCNNAERQEIVGSHLGHNTRGRCVSGPQTGETRGAPDLMFTEAPALDPDFPPNGQPLYDYATDPASEPATNPHLDIGLAMPWTSSDSCLLQSVLNTQDLRGILDGTLSSLTLPSLPGNTDGLLDLSGSDSNKHLRVHTWLSPPVQGEGGVMTGRGTLELYTKTVNGSTHRGEVCVWMFVRQVVTIPIRICAIVCLPIEDRAVAIDIPVINVGTLAGGDCRSGTGLNLTHFNYAQDPWPSDWTEISIPMCFAMVNSAGAVIPAVLPPQSRLGLGVMVRRQGTQPGDGLEFMYDASGWESRLEIETDRILSF